MNSLRSVSIRCTVLIMSLLCVTHAHAQMLIPDVDPPFKVNTGVRQDAQLRIGSFVQKNTNYEQPAFWLGNKRIGVRELDGIYKTDRDQVITLHVDDRLIMSITFWGTGQDKTGAGYPFGNIDKKQPGKLTYNKSAQTITYTKPYLLPDGKNATFNWTMKPGKTGQVIVTWDMGITQSQFDTYAGQLSVEPWFIFGKYYRDYPITVNGKTVAFASLDDLTTDGHEVLNGKTLKLVYAPDESLQQFTVTTSDNLGFAMREKTMKPGSDRLEMIVRTNNHKRLVKDSMTIDFGMTAQKDAQAPPPIAGVDFWQRDRLHIQAPITRNHMPNPSFEQGLRYWSWWWGGATYHPDQEGCYTIADEGVFGNRSLWLKPAPARQSLNSFSIPVKKNQKYTISFYAMSDVEGKGFSFGAYCPLAGSRHGYQDGFATKHVTSTQWKRYSFTYDSDQLALCLLVTGTGGNLWIDGVQIEEGTNVTDFVCPDVEGRLLTSNIDNMLEKGAPIQARYELSGKPGLSGHVKLTLENVFKETLYSDDRSFTLDNKGQSILPLDLSPEKIGEGVYVIKAEYVTANQPTYCDYDRMDIMDSLANRHPTKNLYGSLTHAFRMTRAEDSLARYMRWGLGSTSYNSEHESSQNLLDKYRILNTLCIASDVLRGEQRDLLHSLKKDMVTLPENMAELVEKAAYDAAMMRPWVRHWALTTETEGCPLVRQKRFKEYAENILIPAYKGFKRANPEIIVYPDGGTSGYSMTRGYHQMEEYLRYTQGIVKWDAIAVHPYWNLDGTGGTNDWDAETQRLKDQMARYGLGADTPIDFTECFNMLPTDIPEWGADNWGDTYLSGIPTYDWGWREYIHATWVCRTFVMSLKHWPQLRSTNIWMARPYLDLNLKPWAMCKVSNTLGHLLPEPKFIADVRPMGGIRGYAFEDTQGRPIIAIWCAIDRVEDGVERGPLMMVDFANINPQYIDMMGNLRKAPIENGMASIQLAPAPIFIVGAKGQTQALIKAVNNADIIGATNTLNLAVMPQLDGTVNAQLTNQTNRKVSGELQIQDQKIPYTLDPKAQQAYGVNQAADNTAGKMFKWSDQIRVKQEVGPAFNVSWDMQYFYVPHVDSPLPANPDSPLWKAIPAIPMTNIYKQNPGGGEPAVKTGYAGDLDVTYQMAWDKDNLYLRIDAVDDVVHLTSPARWVPTQLYMHDGCVELYLDTTANGRSNQTLGFDIDDYRYDIYAGSAKAENGPGFVYRFREPNMQLAGGLDMPTKEQAAKGITCEYRRTAKGYSYVLIFPAWYVEPMRLEPGYTAGFGLYIHDIDEASRQWPRKGKSLATKQGAHCDKRPDLWPMLILGK